MNHPKSPQPPFIKGGQGGFSSLAVLPFFPGCLPLDLPGQQKVNDRARITQMSLGNPVEKYIHPTGIANGCLELPSGGPGECLFGPKQGIHFLLAIDLKAEPGYFPGFDFEDMPPFLLFRIFLLLGFRGRRRGRGGWDYQ